MPHFAIREETGKASIEELADMARAHGNERYRLVGAYWTPEQGHLFSVFAGDGSAKPGRGAPEPEALPVLPITADEYGPPLMEPAAGAGDALPLVLVRRQLDPMTHQEFRAIALQAIMCAYEYQDMRWLRSYWARTRNELYCLFRTRAHDLVREHARRSRIPCDEVHDAIEIVPEAGQLTVLDAADPASPRPDRRLPR